MVFDDAISSFKLAFVGFRGFVLCSMPLGSSLLCVGALWGTCLHVAFVHFLFLRTSLWLDLET